MNPTTAIRSGTNLAEIIILVSTGGAARSESRVTLHISGNYLAVNPSQDDRRPDPTSEGQPSRPKSARPSIDRERKRNALSNGRRLSCALTKFVFSPHSPRLLQALVRVRVE
jgi:hypothetical protein